LFRFLYAKHSIIVFFAFWVYVAWFTGCSGVPSEYQEFFALPLDRHDEAIHRYPLEKQVEIYLIAMTVIRPPEIGLVYDVARNGKTIVPLLIKRLATVETRDEMSALLYVLLEIDLRVYPWRKDPESIALLKQVLPSIANVSWRQRVERLISE